MPHAQNISLDVPAGQTIAIVGASGAGKMTLVNLIPRFDDPWVGRVWIDGHDVRNVRLQSLRDQVAIVSQETILFPLSVAENIAYGRRGAMREEIEAAARGRTTFVIAHRLSTVRRADRILVLKEGTIAESRSHESLMRGLP